MLYIISEYFHPFSDAGGPIRSIENILSYFKSGSNNELASGLRFVFFNSNANNVGNPIVSNLDSIFKNRNFSDGLSPFTGRIQCLGSFPYFMTLKGYMTSIESGFSSFRTMNSLYSLHSLNKNIEPWSASSNLVSNSYSANNKINPVDHFSFDFFLIKEYSHYRSPATSISNAIISTSIITKDTIRSTIDYDYMGFFICSSTNNPFMYSSGNLNLNDIISNVEIEIIRYPR